MKITFAVSAKELSDFLKGEEVSYHGYLDEGIRIECEEKDIILTKQTQAYQYLRRNIQGDSFDQCKKIMREKPDILSPCRKS